MHTMLMLGAALLFPVVCLVLVLWLGHLEETLDAELKQTRRQATPSPIRARPTAIALTHAAEVAADPVQVLSVGPITEPTGLSAAS